MLGDKQNTDGIGRRALLGRAGTVVAGSAVLGSTGAAGGDGASRGGADHLSADVASNRNRRTGRTVLDGSDPEISWTTQLDVEHAEILPAGDVFLVLRDDLIAIDAFDGSVRWRKENFLPLSPRAGIVDGTAYVVGRFATLYALDPGTGDIHWTFEPEGRLGSMRADDGRLAITIGDGRWYVVDAEDGSVETSGQLDEEATSLAGFGDGMLYAYDLGGSSVEGFGTEIGGVLHAVSTETERVEWTTDEPIRGAIYDGESLYATLDGPTLVALDPETGQRQWTLDGWESEHELVVPTLRDGSLFGAGWDVLERIDPETGERLWAHHVSEGANPLFPEGISDEVVVTARGMRVSAIDRETGEETWAHSLDGSRSNAVFEDGVLYVGAAGNVRALDGNGSERWSLSVEGPDGLLDEPEVVKTHGSVCVLNGEYLTGIDVNEPPEADFEVDVRATTVGDTVTFEAVASDGEFPEEALTYEWEFGDGAEASGKTVEHTYDSPDSYTVTLTVTDPPGETDTASATLEVEPTPTPTPVSEDLPGFGVGIAAASLAGAAGWLARRQD